MKITALPPLRRFQKWPADALAAVAYKFLKEMNLEEEMRGKLVQLCQQVLRLLVHPLAWLLACPFGCLSVYLYLFGCLHPGLAQEPRMWTQLFILPLLG